MRQSMLLAAAVLAGVAAPASAVPIFLNSIAPSVSTPGAFTFEYRAEFAQDEGIESGSRLVIFDFAGYVPGSIFAPAGITTSTELTSTDLLPPGRTDDGALTNLVFTYNGPRIDLSQQTFAGFGALSQFGGFVLDGFSSTTVKTGGATGTLIFTQGSVGVPAAVPEPAAWALMIAGFGLAGSAMRRRRGTTVVFA